MAFGGRTGDFVDPGRAQGALVGLACGDALGTTLEFRRDLPAPRFPSLADGPHREVTGGGPFQLLPGMVTDDTQMACCLAASLAENGRFAVEDVARRYVAWSRQARDIGGQTWRALDLVQAGMAPSAAGRAVWVETGWNGAGNGSLMRTAPIGVHHAADPPERRRAAFADSAITHFDFRCQLACAAFDAAIAAALTRAAAPDRSEIVAACDLELDLAAEELAAAHADLEERVLEARNQLATDLRAARRDDPQLYGPELRLTGPGIGYVRVAFRLAFWELLHAPSFEAGLLDVVNRGGDADTNGAVAGALLGAFHGVDGIPIRWRSAVLDGPVDERLGALAETCHPRALVGALAGGRPS